jgi:hypothetical protein
MQAPKHYGGDTKLMDLLVEKQVPFAEGNVMKYVYRWREKDGLKDLYKARIYLDAVIADAERNYATNELLKQTEQINTENCKGV